MFRKIILGSILAACLMAAPTATRGASPQSSDSINVTVDVDNFAEWATVGGPFPMTTSIGSMAATPSVVVPLTLYSNVSVTIATSSDGTGVRHNGVLTSGTSTLTTKYLLLEHDPGTHPAHLTNAHTYTTLQLASDFLDASNTYSLTHDAGLGVYSLDLTVQASVPTAPTLQAPDAGTYECGVTLTASWS